MCYAPILWAAPKTCMRRNASVATNSEASQATIDSPPSTTTLRDLCRVGTQLHDRCNRFGVRWTALGDHRNMSELASPISVFKYGEFFLATVVKMIRRDDDPLGYEGEVLARVRAMAEDAIAGINEDCVEDEAAVLRSRLHLKPRRQDDDAHSGR